MREAVLASGPIQLSIGHFVDILIDFLVITLVIFVPDETSAKDRAEIRR